MKLRDLLLCGLLAALSVASTSDANAARTTTYYHTDGQGSVIAATNQAGQVLWRKDYAPFGEQIDTTPDTERQSFTGKQHDAATGLTYFGARYYDPEMGRFLSADPVAFVEDNAMSFNRYLYVNNNPYKYVDPDGEFLNFAAKFVLDVAINVAFNYVTTGELNVGGALKESASGILNPAKTVAKAGKLAGLVGKSKKTQQASAAFVNGNSKASQKAQHGYEIVDKRTGGVCKTGVSGCKLNKNGSSPRANGQAKRWNMEPGNAGRYEPRVVKEVPAGPGAREEILNWEKGNAAKHAADLDPARHSRP